MELSQDIVGSSGSQAGLRLLSFTAQLAKILKSCC